MAVIGVDYYPPPTTAIGNSAAGSSATAPATKLPGAEAPTPAAAPQTGPQPLNSYGPLGTSYNVLT